MAISTSSTAGRRSPRATDKIKTVRESPNGSRSAGVDDDGGDDHDAGRRHAARLRSPATARSRSDGRRRIADRRQGRWRCSRSSPATASWRSGAEPRRSSKSISTGSSGRATIMPGSASAISPRRATRARSRSRAPPRCRASTRCAPTSRSAWRRACSCPSRARPAPGSTSSAPTIDNAEPHPRRQCDERLGDVGGQCRDRQPRARHRRRQMPPDRRQSAHHAAPQPRMARDAGAAAAGLRRRGAFRGPRPGPARVRRRRRGQSHAAGARAWRTGASRSSSMASRAAPSPRASMSRRRGRSPASTGSIPSGPFSSPQSEEAIAAGAFHNDVVAVANGPVLFAHEKAFADRDALIAELRARMPSVRVGRGRRRRGAAGRRDHSPICSTPSW